MYQKSIVNLIGMKKVNGRESYTDEGFLIIEVIPYQSMCWEFDPGPFLDSYNIYHFRDISESGEKIDSKDLKDYYKYVQGRSERISFHRLVKEIKENY